MSVGSASFHGSVNERSAGERSVTAAPGIGFAKKVSFVAITIAVLSYFPAILSYYRIFYMLVVLGFCILLAFVRLGRVAKKQALQSVRYLVVFLGYLALTAIWAEYPGRTVFAVAIDLIFILVWSVFFVLDLMYREEEVARIFMYVPYVVAATFAYLLLRFGALRPFDETSTDQIGATANLCGQWLVVSLPFIYWLIRRGDKRRYFELCLALFLIAIAQSRTAYLLVLLFFVVETIIYGKSAKLFFVESAKFAGVLVLLAALAWILPVTKPLVADGLQRAVTTQTDDDTVVDIEREEMLLVGWEAFREHPWLGIGYHNLGERIGEDFSREIESHNIVLTLVAECGWPGFIVFCMMIWEFFKRTTRVRKMLDAETGGFYMACQISLVAALLTGMAFPLLEFPLFYAVLGLGYASTVTSRNSTATAFSHSA